MARTAALRPTGEPVEEVLARAGTRRPDVEALVALCREVTGDEPVVWAGRLIGFGRYDYRYESGHGGSSPVVSVAPGARHTTVHLSGYLDPADLRGLGRHRAGKGCLYLPRLAEVDLAVLRGLLERSVAAHRGGPGGGS